MVTQLMIALTSGSKLYVYGLLNGPIIQNFDIAPMLWKDVQLCAFLV